MKMRDVIAGLGSLAQETRLAIYRLLVQKGPEGLAARAILPGSKAISTVSPVMPAS